MAARSGLIVAITIATLATLTAWPTAFADPTPSPNACQNTPPTNPVARVTCDVANGGLGGVAGDVTHGAGQAASNAVQGAADATEVAFTTWLANGAIWIVQNVTQAVIGPSTTPSLDPGQAAMYADVYGRVVGVALSLSTLLVLIAVIEAVLTQRPGGLRRIVAGIAAFGIGLGTIPVGTAILMKITDDLSWYVAAQQSSQVAAGLAGMIHVLQDVNPGSGAAAFAMIALGIMIGGALLWLELATRGALIYLLLGVAPLACAAVLWPRLEGVLRQVLFAGVALILSKLVIAIALAVGFAVMSITGTGLAGALGGMFILLIAALMPFATARLLPLAAEELSLAHQGRMRRYAVTGVGTTARVAMAATTGGATAPSALPVAPPMGGSTAGPGASAGSGPVSSGGESGPARRGPSQARSGTPATQTWDVRTEPEGTGPQPTSPPTPTTKRRGPGASTEAAPRPPQAPADTAEPEVR